jgi:hypothetical protein
MTTEQLIESMKSVLSLFAAQHLNYPVMFKSSLNNTKPNGISLDILHMQSSTGQLLLSFIIMKDRRIYDQKFKSIEVKIHEEKHLNILNTFIAVCSQYSSNSFNLFMNETLKQTDHLKLITSVDVLPLKEREIIVDDKYIRVDFAIHAIMTTPFEVINIYKIPKFIFENNKFYLHDKFSFTSLGQHYTFAQKTEDIDIMKVEVKDFAQKFYEEHYEIITSKINELYDVPFTEFGLWTDEQFRAYYPVLSMERY